MYPTIAAIVELFPLPVTLVTRIQPAFRVRYPFEYGGKLQVGEARYLDRDDSHDDRKYAPLPHDIHAEPPQPRQSPRAIEVRELVDRSAILLERNQLQRQLTHLSM